ncbi:MAG: hypothetical protein HKO81_09235 [Flavobacteriaceae bacterium]|nr:hypothetical protein [Flavobacteriaceae bacterium]
MSKSKLPEQPNSEEVDLGQLFNLIGNAFNRLFNFIASIFKGLYHVLLMLLIHVYKRIKWYAIAILLGFIIGYTFDKLSDDLYGANVYLETNYKSTRQAYEVIRNFHQLTVDKDTLELSKRLNISTKEASSLKGFYIEPDLDENVMMIKYVEYKKGLDSIAREESTYKGFKESLSAYSFPIHMIGVVSTDKFIYKKLKSKLIEEIINNEFLTELKEVYLKNLDQREIDIDREIKILDSLKTEYLKIRIQESSKEIPIGSGTNILMGGTSADPNAIIKDETVLVNRIYELENEKQTIATNRIQNKNLVNVISDFPDSGYDISEWTDKMKIVLPILFFLITFLGFILSALEKYLSDQDRLIHE